MNGKPINSYNNGNMNSIVHVRIPLKSDMGMSKEGLDKVSRYLSDMEGYKVTPSETARRLMDRGLLIIKRNPDMIQVLEDVINNRIAIEMDGHEEIIDMKKLLQNLKLSDLTANNNATVYDVMRAATKSLEDILKKYKFNTLVDILNAEEYKQLLEPEKEGQ